MQTIFRLSEDDIKLAIAKWVPCHESEVSLETKDYPREMNMVMQGMTRFFYIYAEVIKK
jgi:hypothetical protein